MFGRREKSTGTEAGTIVYTEPAYSDSALRLEIGGRLPNTAIEMAGKLPDAVKSLAGGLPDQAKAAKQRAGKVSGRVSKRAGKLSERMVDRAQSITDELPDRARSLAGRLPDRDTARSLVDRLPDPVKDLAQDKLGLRLRRRSRWKTVAIVLAVGVGVAAALLLIKRVFAPGYDERSLYDGTSDEMAGGAGQPHVYPTAGSGSGWPEPQHTPEHTEMRAGANGAAQMQDGPTNRGLAEMPPESTAHGSAGSPIPDMLSRPPAPAVPAQPSVQPAMPATGKPTASGGSNVPDGSFYALESRGGDAALAEPSLPPQRPEVPFTEAQAEMNARLQLKQDELYAAFPTMTREEIVACDGDLDRLAALIRPRTEMQLGDVRSRLDQILGTSPEEATNPVLPDSE